MDPKQIAQQWFEYVWNRKHPAVFHSLIHEDADAHTEGGIIVGPDNFRDQMFLPLIAAFPDIEANIDRMISEGDVVVIRWTAKGTHAGEFAGIPPSNRTITFSGMTWFNTRDGKIAGGWDHWNFHGLLALLSAGVESQNARFSA